jgi:ketosteroid isomerase-like protein
VQAKGKNLTHSGIAYDNDYCFVITMREGKIATYEEYCDTELIANVLGDRLSAWRPAEKR